MSRGLTIENSRLIKDKGKMHSPQQYFSKRQNNPSVCQYQILVRYNSDQPASATLL
jgi:hypothetical protein